MDAHEATGYPMRVIAGLAVCLLASFAAGAWAATLVIAAAITLAGIVTALLLVSLGDDDLFSGSRPNSDPDETPSDRPGDDQLSLRNRSSPSRITSKPK